jgi:hypothetical protein
VVGSLMDRDFRGDCLAGVGRAESIRAEKAVDG